VIARLFYSGAVAPSCPFQTSDEFLFLQQRFPELDEYLEAKLNVVGLSTDKAKSAHRVPDSLVTPAFRLVSEELSVSLSATRRAAGKPITEPEG
jgi:peroxiredoxin